MVALLVRLKLTLLRNSLRRSVWRTVGLVLGLVYAAGLVAGAVAGLVALRFTSNEITSQVTVLVFAAVTAGWLVFSLLVFGVDETVDPAKFALLPLRSRELLPGLLVANAVGVPGLATVLVALGLLVAWSRSVPLVLAALVAAVLGVATCLLLARAATSAFAAFLSSRRYRDLAFIALALFGVSFAVIGNLGSTVADLSPERLRSLLATAATVAGWTPFGWAWAVPADLARGQVGVAALHLVLAIALVAGLWRTWDHFLAARLVQPLEGTGSSAQASRSGWVDRLYPATPTGAVAARTLRYWRRDPRYLAGIAGLVVAPVAFLVVTSTSPAGNPSLAVLAPAVMALLVSSGLAADLSYDGSAVWTHVTAGLDGLADRRGRVLSSLTVYVPALVLMLLAAALLTGGWRLMPVAVGLTAAALLIGLGVAAYVGALWQWPAPPPGASPFQRGNSGGLPALLAFAVHLPVTTLLALPTVALAVASIWFPWTGWLTLPVGLASGAVVLAVGTAQAGRLLERRWPEVMVAVSERAA